MSHSTHAELSSPARIHGGSAAEIAQSVRDLVDRGRLHAGDALPPVRQLAEHLGVNRNTVVSAYGQLTRAGVAEGRGRAGTRIAGAVTVAQDGFTPDSVLHDVGDGNPDPAFIPDPSRALSRVTRRPVLYGEPVVDGDLEEWSGRWMRQALDPSLAFALTVTAGAADAVERLLAQALERSDAVGLEDPCFLASLNTVRLGGYRPVSIPVDSEGMTPEGLHRALRDGVRAIICTPRAQNPTGASLSAARAHELRVILAHHPYVLIVEDDHFSMLSRSPYHSLIPPGHRRFALVRSVSKFLGPDMCLAVTASDPTTAENLARRLSPGTTWVSHLLQRLAVALLTDTHALGRIDAARAHYATRNALFAGLLTDRGLDTEPRDGLSLWVTLPAPARAVGEQLMRRGWLARTGSDFHLSDDDPDRHMRLTVHRLSDVDAARLADDLAASVRGAEKVK